MEFRIESYIQLLKGKKMEEKAWEKRKGVRHKADFQSSINALICDGDTYPLFAPILINVVDISKSGIRFNAPHNTFLVGDKFTVQVKLKEDYKFFAAMVINIMEKDSDESEYGCLLTDRQKEV